MECKKCGYEIEGTAVYCQSCFERLLDEIGKLQKEIERLKEKNKDLENKIDIMELEGGRRWKGKRKFH